MRRAASAAWPVVLAALLGRCSVVVGNFEVPACRPNSTDCDALNREMGVAATSCERWACSARTLRCARTADADGDGEPRAGCGGNDCDDGDARRSSRTAETCDGRDNNCNQVIDEGALSPGGAVVGVPLGADVDRLAVSSRGPAAGVSWHRAGSQQQGVAVLRAGAAVAGPVASIRYMTHQGTDTTQALTLMEACPEGSCAFGDLGLDDAPAAGDWFAAAIDTSGCTAGRARVGLLRTAGAQAGAFLAVGPESRSTSFRALGTCGAGATAPTVARLREAPTLPRALAAWVAAPDDRRACDAPAPVQVMGLWLEASATAIPWVNATRGGAPQTLGMTRGRGRPAVASWHRGDEALAFGWFAAWADAAGGVAAQFVPPMGEAPAFSPALPPTTPRATPELDLSMTPARIEAGTGVSDHVALAVGPQGVEGVAVGVAWRDGCLASAGNVWFSRALYQGTARTWTTSPRVQLSAGGTAGAPAIAFVDDGFVTGSFARGGVVAGEGAEGRRGGWLVAWAEGGRVMGRRVAAVDGAALDDAPVVLASEAVRMSGDVALTRGEPAGLRALWVDADAQALESAAVLCPAGAAR